jgi:phospho-N-acetylmuramoyl-pentapeptide-transferase
MAAVTAFFISVTLGPWIISKLRQLKIGQNIRREYVEDLYELHKHKTGTPTMGGLIILISVLASTLLWARPDNKYIILSVLCIVWLGAVGFVDDYIKLVKKRSMGLRASAKFIGQVSFALLVGVFLYMDSSVPTTLRLPFMKDVIINLGLLYIVFVSLVIVGSSNAVNLTDGLDGLAIGCVTIIAITYGILSYITGNVNLSDYLNVYHSTVSGELAVLCTAIMGAGFGFLWFNSYPASVFMGDTGSLALGGVIGLISILIKKEILLVIVGGIFVIEVLSVIIQVVSFKTRKKKVFLMSPIHHHFQLKGMHESKVIIRFWIVAAILSLFSLMTLKLQ